MTTDDAVRVLLAGGCLRLGAYTTNDAVRLALAASQGGGHLTIVGRYTTDDAVRISLAGKSHVTLDFATVR